jgi:hypothetical protein
MEDQRAVEKQLDHEVPGIVFDFPGPRDGKSTKPVPSPAPAEASRMMNLARTIALAWHLAAFVTYSPFGRGSFIPPVQARAFP